MRDQKGLKAMVLAAGVGSRLDPLTRQVPKPLVPIANRPVMEHILCLLKRHGVTEVMSNLHYLPEHVPAYFGDGSQLGMKLGYKVEATLSGDAGGVRACKEFFEGGTFLVVMGDLISDADLSYVIEQHRSKGALATIALQKVADVSRFGVAVTDPDGYIKGFQEKPAPHEAISDLASTGIYVLEPEIFKHMPEEGEYGFGRQLFPALVKNGLPVLGVQIFGYWSDMGTVPHYLSTSFDALDGLVDIDMPGNARTIGSHRCWTGSKSTVADDCRVEGSLLVGQNTQIGPGVRLKGHVIIGDNCVVESRALLQDCIVWSGTTIGARANLKDTVVGAGCHIGAGARLHGQATISSTRDTGDERPLKQLGGTSTMPAFI